MLALPAARALHVLHHLRLAFAGLPAADEEALALLPLPTAAAEAFFGAAAPHPTDADREWATVLGERVPAFFGADLVSSAFYWLSGWQEVHSAVRDRFGRFPFEASLQAQLGCIGVPVTDYLLEALRQALEARNPGLTLRPRQPGLRVWVTHDVDSLRSGWRQGASHYWRAGRYREALRLALRRLVRDPFDNLETVAAVVQEETGQPSTFFALGAKGRTPLGPNADYLIRPGKREFNAGERFREVQQRFGSEIGLHGSFGTATDGAQLQRELALINLPAAGLRFHYLCFDPVRTPALLHNTPLLYDATLGFPERIGFRHGTAREFRLFDFVNQRSFNVPFRPLHVMDVTLRNAHYQPTHPEQIPAAVAGLARHVQRLGGTLTLLWHNEYLVPWEAHLGEDTFRAVLRTLRAAGAEFVAPPHVPRPGVEPG